MLDGLPINVFNALDMDGFWPGYARGEWEADTFTIFNRFIKPGDVVVDFGAWFGITAIYLGYLTENTYALEADPRAYMGMASHVYINPHLRDRVHIEPNCIGVKTGKQSFYLKTQWGGDSTSNLHQATGHKVDVDCFTLEDWAKLRGLDHLDFLKIDVEGYEQMLIPELVDYLKSLPRVPHMWLSLHPTTFPRPGDGDGIGLALQALYKVCYHEATQEKVPLGDGFTQAMTDKKIRTIMCTNTPHDEIAWWLDLTPKKGLKTPFFDCPDAN